MWLLLACVLGNDYVISIKTTEDVDRAQRETAAYGFEIHMDPVNPIYHLDNKFNGLEEITKNICGADFKMESHFFLTSVTSSFTELRECHKMIFSTLSRLESMQGSFTKLNDVGSGCGGSLIFENMPRLPALPEFQSLETVGENLEIKSSGVETLTGTLLNLHSIKGVKLETLTHLNSIGEFLPNVTIIDEIFMKDVALQDLSSAFPSLKSVTKSIVIEDMPNLRSFGTAFDDLESIGEPGDNEVVLKITGNNNLISFGNAFRNLKRIHGKVEISTNSDILRYNFGAIANVSCHGGFEGEGEWYPEEFQKPTCSCLDDPNVPNCPTASPTASPTSSPTLSQPTLSPSRSPTANPTLSEPTISPTVSPTLNPTRSDPTTSPSGFPTASPLPSDAPTQSTPSPTPAVETTATSDDSSDTTVIVLGSAVGILSVLSVVTAYYRVR